MTDDAASLDVVSDARGARPRRRWPVVVLAVVVALGLLGAWADRRQRGHEFDALIARAANAQASVVDAARKVESTRAYTMPLLVSSSSVTLRAGLGQLIDESAARGETSVRAARDALAKLRIVPWHGDLRRAKAAMLAYLDQRVSDLDLIANGGDFAALTSAEAGAAAVRASTALRAAAPSGHDATRAAKLFVAPP